MQERIIAAVQTALSKRGLESSFVVEKTANFAHGDYATNIALALSKQLKRSPMEVAQELVPEIAAALGESAASVTAAAPGFINVIVSRNAVTAALAHADTAGVHWGTGEEGKRVFVEYSNPNPFKEMHIGHLLGTAIGETIARLFENQGNEVRRATFGGDVGPHVAKTLWALQQEGNFEPANAQEIGDAYVSGSHAYDDDPHARAAIDALNVELYEGNDPKLRSLWAHGREVSMSEFRRLWKLLGTTFDFEFFDSDTVSTARRVVADGLQAGVFEKSDGAIVYPGEKEGVHTMVFITSHETPTYEAKDLGLAFLKEERWSADKSIIVTGNEQSGRFKTVLAALAKIAPLIAQKTTHVAHGFLRRASGKMSSRDGSVITASALISEVTAQATERNSDPEIAHAVAVGAIKYMILRQTLGSDIIFDKAKSLSLEGDSGPYLQYALVRGKSVLAKAPSSSSAAGELSAPTVLERLIAQYPEVVKRAAQELAPSHVIAYLIELASAWNSFYAETRIIGGEHEAHYLLVTRAFVQTMQNGLTTLGIPTPEKM